ncbi:T9SS type A sorting domain-containing protein [bacterium]|nr:T9SS type A sorting domain-containing protein [bacterium]
MTKRLILSLLLIVMVQLMFGTITMTYNFEKPLLDENGDYTKITLENCFPNGVPAQPEIPYQGALIYLPQSEEITAVNIRLSNPQEIMLAKPLFPTQQQYPLSLMDQAIFTEPNEEIYGSAKAFPYEVTKNIRTDFMAGHSLGSYAFSPVEYYPKENRIIWYSQASVEIETAVTDKAITAQNLRKDNIAVYNRLIKSVDNPELVPMPNSARNTGIDYLIIYPEEYLTQIQQIEYYHNIRNRNVELLSIEHIESNPVPNGATYRDTPEKIREYIKYYYSQPVNDLQFVLLAGDADVIPHRGFYAANESQSDYDIPSDCYYSNLDGSWDTDGDNIFGEQQETDLMPELAIGRICYNNISELDNIINKLHKFTEEPVMDLVETSVMVGEWLWEGPTWGGDHMDELIGHTNLYGYQTTGFPEDWVFSKLYDRDYGYADAWYGSQLFPLLNQGATYVNHLGHSNTTYNMRLSNDYVTVNNITNNGNNGNFSVHFTQGCYAGSFDNRGTNVGSYGADCITEKFTAIETSAAAMISHSRYGWGVMGSTNGVSQKYHRQWVDAIFTEEIVEIGETLNDCKIDNIPMMDNSTMYWVYYQTNLFGDPAMNLWKETPAVIQENIVTTWAQGQNAYPLVVTTPNASAALVNNDNDILWTGQRDILGNMSVNTTTSLVAGDYRLILNAAYHLPKVIEIEVIQGNQPFIGITSLVNNNSTNNFSANDVTSFNLDVMNLGTESFAGDAYMKLVSMNEHLEVVEDSLHIGSLAGEEVTSFSNAFEVRNMGGHADQEDAELRFITYFGEQESVTQTHLTLNASVVALESVTLANGALAPEANANNPVNIAFTNNGTGYARNIELIFYSYYTGITVSPASYQIAEIAPNETITLEDIFSININDSIQDYEPGNFVVTIVDPFFSVDEFIYDFLVGLDMFTFETGNDGFITEQPSNQFVNQWHRSNNQNNTPNGSYSFKFGGAGSNHYSNSAYGYLISPTFSIVPNSQFVFYHKMNAEKDATNTSYAWDGGYLEMSVNGGNFNIIEPVGSYPYYMRTNQASPIPGSTPVYSGNFPWSQAVFNLGNTSGQVQFRFVFGSDGATVAEGWYVDDIHVVAPTDNITNEVDLLAAKITGNYPNPFNPETTINFAIPTNSSKTNALVEIEIYNLKGQKVKTLLKEHKSPGNYQVVWKGDNDQNKSVASGIYFAKLKVGKNTDFKKMVLMK